MIRKTGSNQHQLKISIRRHGSRRRVHWNNAVLDVERRQSSTTDYWKQCDGIARQAISLGRVENINRIFSEQ